MTLMTCFKTTFIVAIVCATSVITARLADGQYESGFDVNCKWSVSALPTQPCALANVPCPGCDVPDVGQNPQRTSYTGALLHASNPEGHDGMSWGTADCFGTSTCFLGQPQLSSFCNGTSRCQAASTSGSCREWVFNLTTVNELRDYALIPCYTAP